MRTLNVSISDKDREIAVANLDSCLQVAERYGLSKMPLADINEEIKIARKDIKARKLDEEL